LPARAECFTDSSSEDEACAKPKPKHILKPPKFETFLAHFQHCAVYNQWTEVEKLVYLRGNLEKDAGQMLWDYSAEATNSLKEMVKVLKGDSARLIKRTNTEWR